MHRYLNCAAIALTLALLPAASPTLAADTSGQQPAGGPINQGLRVFTTGHSFHQFVIPILQQIAEAAGIQDHQLAGKSSIGGSRVIQHWDVADDKNGTKAALEAGKVDVLQLAPIWMPDEGIERFAKLGFEHNPNIRITVQEFWLPNDTYEPKYPLDTRKKVDHDAVDLAQLQKNQDSYDHDVDEFCSGINRQLGKQVLFTVPVGQAAVKLREKIVAGQAPGVKTQTALFRDNWGHPQLPLRLLAGYCHFAVIYRRNPVGLGVPPVLAEAKDMSDDDKAKLNRLLQELAWDAVTHHPQSGVSAK